MLIILTIMLCCTAQKFTYQGRIQSLERGGHLAEKKLKSQKKKKKKKVTTIIASYPLPNILYHVCYVK